MKIPPRFNEAMSWIGWTPKRWNSLIDRSTQESVDFTFKEVKKRVRADYRALVKKLHPDLPTAPPDAEERVKVLNACMNFVDNLRPPEPVYTGYKRENFTGTSTTFSGPIRIKFWVVK